MLNFTSHLEKICSRTFAPQNQALTLLVTLNPAMGPISGGEYRRATSPLALLDSLHEQGQRRAPKLRKEAD